MIIPKENEGTSFVHVCIRTYVWVGADEIRKPRRGTKKLNLVCDADIRKLLTYRPYLVWYKLIGG